MSLRGALLKDHCRLPEHQRAELDTLVAQVAAKRTPRAWLYLGQLCEIFGRKQFKRAFFSCFGVPDGDVNVTNEELISKRLPAKHF